MKEFKFYRNLPYYFGVTLWANDLAEAKKKLMDSYGWSVFRTMHIDGKNIFSAQ